MYGTPIDIHTGLTQKSCKPCHVPEMVRPDWVAPKPQCNFTRRMDVEGHGWYNGRIGSLSGFHSILQGLQGTEATTLGTAQQFALNHKPSHLRAPADEGGFAESRAHNYISVMEIPKRRIPCSPSGPFHCRDSKQRAQGHSQEVGYYCWVR